MRPLPDIYFQVPSLQEGVNHWGWLDRDKSKFTVDVGGSLVSGRLSATQRKLFALLLENAMRSVNYDQLDKNPATPISNIRTLLAAAVEHKKAELELRISDELQERMRSWLGAYQGTYRLAVQAYQGRNVSRRDRLLRSFSSGQLGRAPTSIPTGQNIPPIGREYGSEEFCREPEVRTLICPTQNLDRVLLIFAAERAVVHEDGMRQIMRHGEAAPPNLKSTLDDLTGDTVSVSILSSCLAEFGFGLDAMAPTAANEIIKSLREEGKARPLLFVGSAYANLVLRAIENESWRTYPYGARFDFDAPLTQKGLRVTFKSKSGNSSCEWLQQHYMERSRDIAVIRRWRTAEGCDAMMAAGMTAQGTVGAVRFLCDEECVDELFNYLVPDAHRQNRDDVESLEFDAVLAVPLKVGIAAEKPNKTTILAGAPRH